MKITLDIVLVNRNSGDLIKTCLHSIGASFQTEYKLNKIIIVDDCSNDGSLVDIGFNKLPVLIFLNETRLGYGASCNKGAFGGTADLILFLNTDIRLNQDTLDISVRNYLQFEEKSIGILGIQLRELDGKVSRSTSRFPSAGNLVVESLFLNKAFPRYFNGIQTDWDHCESRIVDQVMGAFMLMKRDLFEEVGGFSRKFFVYMEDLDLSMRISQMGFKSYYLTETSALHLGGGTARKLWWESLFFLHRSRIQYSFIYFGKIKGSMIAFCTLFIGPFIRIFYQLFKLNFFDIKSTLIATVHLFIWSVMATIKSDKQTN